MNQMASGNLPEPPAPLKAIQGYMRIAQDIERLDPVVAYWVRLFSTESALRIDKESAEAKNFLSALIVWLEKFKQTHKDNETVSNQTVGQAHMENFVVALFTKADTLDRDGRADKSTVRMFYMAAMLFEAMAVFGPLTEEVSKKAKYAKFKAAYIQKCLKSGIAPKPGPIESSDLELDSQTGASASSSEPTTSDQTDNGDIKSNSNVGGGGGYASTGVLDIPEVPKDNEPESSWNSKKQDPFILTPSSPPQRPIMPPNVPGYSPNNTMPQISKYPDPATNANTSAGQQASSITGNHFHATNGAPLKAEDLIKSQKYCKFANSALQYDDVPTAVANLQKALKLLTTGQNPD